jgi:ribosomal protein S7
VEILIYNALANIFKRSAEIHIETLKQAVEHKNP